MVKCIFRNLVFCTSLLLCAAGPLIAQEIVWADTVISLSSEKSPKLFGACQVTGAPNKYPNPAFSTCAWSPEYNEARDTEFLRVGFKQPMQLKKLLIVENHNAGNILRIYLGNAGTPDALVYENTDAHSLGGGRMFTLDLQKNTRLYQEVLLVMAKPTLNNTYQIDAIGMSAEASPALPAISLASTPFMQPAERLGEAVNSTYDEVYPVVSPDGNVLYFDRKLHPGNTGPEHADDIWFSKQIHGTWTVAENLGPPLNNNFHNFLCAISPDGNTALVGNTYSPDGQPGGGVSITSRTAEVWSMPKTVDIHQFVNLNPYNEFHLSAGGNVLLMSIETPIGKGLLDLYVSFRESDGSFSAPRHLGAVVNSAGNEMTPFLASDEKTLYFSSNGFPGFGNQDIYMTRRLDDSWTNWTPPVNLGPEVNTAEWDVYFSVDARGEYGYYSSSRSAVTNLDIFRVQMPPDLLPEHVLWLKGKITDRTTGQPIAANLVYQYGKENERQGSGICSNNGAYVIVLPGDGRYRIQLSATGYLSMDTLINLDDLSVFREKKQDFSLVPGRTGVIVEMRNILFEVNSYTLTDSSFIELNRIAEFLQLNSGVSVEIRGHTNGLCDDTYCNTLSARRAQAVVEYLINQGIAPERLSFKGYGKTVPVADNSSPEGRKANQRVEFMITAVEQ